MQKFIFLLFTGMLLFSCSKDIESEPIDLNTNAIGSAGGSFRCLRVSVPLSDLAPFGQQSGTYSGEINKHTKGNCMRYTDLCSINYATEVVWIDNIDPNAIFTPAMQDNIISDAKSIFFSSHPNATLQSLNLYRDATCGGCSQSIFYDIDYVIGECDAIVPVKGAL